MNDNDHPRPHFYVRYVEHMAIFAVESPVPLAGELSPRALGLVMASAAAHRQELLGDWNLARQRRRLNRHHWSKAMSRDVISVQRLSEQRLHVTFDDGVEGVVNVSQIVLSFRMHQKAGQLLRRRIAYGAR